MGYKDDGSTLVKKWYSLIWSFKNNTNKTIKYARFWFTAYNAVGDETKCTCTNEALKSVRCTGPVEPGGICNDVRSDYLWCSADFSYAKLSYVDVEYMDGTEERVNLSNISFSVPEGVSAGGCYVATAVYGSYDCPEVWVLRRYRDNTLAETWYGRAFVRIYYATSPTLVKWFGETEWFKRFWRGRLDSMVEALQEKGVESTPYEDKNW